MGRTLNVRALRLVSPAFTAGSRSCIATSERSHDNPDRRRVPGTGSSGACTRAVDRGCPAWRMGVLARTRPVAGDPADDTLAPPADVRWAWSASSAGGACHVRGAPPAGNTALTDASTMKLM